MFLSALRITYTGNLLLQKEFIEDPVTKKRRKNRAQFTTTYTDEDGMYTTWVCGSRKQKQKGEPCMAKEIPDKILKAT